MDAQVIDLKKKGFGTTRAPDVNGSGRSSKEDPSRWIYIDDIDVDFTKNARVCLYEWNGEPCCFRPEDADDLIHSFQEQKTQLQPVIVSVNPATRRHTLWDGYRRAFAVMVARERGIELPQGYSLLCRKEPPPKTAAGHAERIGTSVAMQCMMQFDALDLAYNLERAMQPVPVGGGGMSMEDARQWLGRLTQHNPSFRSDGAPMSIDTVRCMLRLNSLDPKTKIEIREGRIKWRDALGRASKRGEGSVRGPRRKAGLKPTEALAFVDRDELKGLIPEQVSRRQLIQILRFVGDQDSACPAWMRSGLEQLRKPRRKGEKNRRKRGLVSCP